MNSETTPEFWIAYRKLDEPLRKAAKKAFELWKENEFHPSLRFKCVDSSENIWAVRISKSHRALCVIEESTAIWFWIGNHDDYEKFYR